MTNPNKTVLEINLRSLEKNFFQIKSLLSNKTTQIMGVVKANGYGSDAIVIAKKLENIGIDYFAVAYASEGKKLRKSGIKTPILVLIPQIDSINTIIRYELEPSLYSFSILNQFLKFVKDYGKPQYPVHIKLNTGLNRVGFVSQDLSSVIDKIIDCDKIAVKSIYSHLAASEDAEEVFFSKNHIKEFEIMQAKIVSKLGYKPMLHICNTSGIINFPEAHYDMVRSGIGLYGYSGVSGVKLSPVHRLRSVVSQIHKIDAKQSVGYNRSYYTETQERIATIPIGHADGITRVFGNRKGFVFINGQKAFIVGNVCMDVIMVDVTDIECQEGDSVVIFDDIHTAEDLCESAGTISYELISSISDTRVSRVIIE